MHILFVINNLYTQGNGLSGSVRRTIQALKARGLEVQVLSAGCGPDGQRPEFPLEKGRLPLFESLVDQQGYSFARSDIQVLRRAVDWADVIHLTEPFVLEVRVCRMARRLHKPCVATYHLHPENLFASAGLGRSLWFNGMTMLVWRNTVFNRCRIVQCPTEQVRRRLEAWHCKAELRVISNGLLPVPPLPRQAPDPEVVRVLCVGRFSREKDQDTLLRAMKSCRNARRIQLQFAGQGPTEQRLRRRAQQLLDQGILVHPPTFRFCTQQELRRLFAQADLYVHCATVEVEGMSCMEAISTGIVPVIAAGRHTATSQFARSPESLFPAGNAQLLAQRLDYWIDHPAERQREAQGNLGMEQNYAFSDSVSALVEMYQAALEGV